MNVHTLRMSVLAFITHLIWPAVVVMAILIFREPLAHLLSRVRSYEGLGQKVSFGDGIAQAETSVEAAAGAEIAAQQRTGFGNDVLAQEAESNPSFVVLQSWEQLSAALADLVGAALPGQSISPTRRIAELQKQEKVTEGFAKAAIELRDLRNRVAHGRHNPSPGEAIAYASAAHELSDIGRSLAGTYTLRAVSS